MSLNIQVGIGLALLLAGWIAGRWASRYDVKSWFTDALWRFVRGGRWKEAMKGDLRDVLEKDAELKRTIEERAGAFKADAGRLGRTGATVKHGALFAIAYGVNLISGPLMLVGSLILAHAAWRWLT